MKYEAEILGDPRFESPLALSERDDDCIANFVDEDDKPLVNPSWSVWKKYRDEGREPHCFELAGPRKMLYFDPAGSRAAIVTCGGLCPGLNDVIRSLVMTLHYRYRVTEIFGIRYGYRGMTLRHGGTAMPLSPEVVENITDRGGSFLGSSRGMYNIVEMVDFLQRRNINMLFPIGGDGTIRGAIEIGAEARRRNMDIAIIGIPKTIDNDIAFIDRSFGFSSAVAKAKEVIDAAHAEARGAPNGIGLVKLMGRYSGYIAARAALASGEANFVLVPELPFELEGEYGFLQHLEKRLNQRKHALIVVAEGAGQHLMRDRSEELGTDPSGNQRLADIGKFLQERIDSYLKDTGMEFTIKYFDPSYLIRATTASADDSIFCFELSENAVHAAFAGRTKIIVGTWHGQFVHIPMELAISRRKSLNPNGPEWLAVVENTGQPLMISPGSAGNV
ncbi:ATP-dependent 6-phosphofructokinase [bacterium]|nr:ATP-dependent 6-phosphofructokinase [candidate division CSSED10-310 bacterium]